MKPVFEIQVVKGNVVNVSADALVNSANNNLMPTDGINKMVFYTAGNELVDACADIGYCEAGMAVMTNGYNSLFKHIIHAVGPYWHGGYDNEARTLASCYIEIMKLVKEHGIKSVAIPAICTGDGGYPRKEAAEIAVCTVRSFAKIHNLDVTVLFVCSNNEDILNYRYLKDRPVDITKLFKRKNIKISEPLNKAEVKAATTSVFVKTLSESKKGKLLNLLIPRLIKEKYNEFVYIPYPFKKEQIDENTYKKYGVSGPFITYDCVDKILFNNKNAVFTIHPVSYRFEDKREDDIISANISESIPDIYSKKDVNQSEISSVDIEAELETLHTDGFFLDKNQKSSTSDIELIDIEKLLSETDEDTVESNSEIKEEEKFKEKSAVIDVDENFNIEEIINAKEEIVLPPDTSTTTDLSGCGQLNNLPVGVYENGKMVKEISYTLNETEVPEGIKKEIEIPVPSQDVKNEDITDTVTIPNKYLLGKVCFRNAEKETGEAICDSSFRIFKDGKALSMVFGQDAFYYPDEDSNEKNILSSATGFVYIKNLPFGEYTIKQKKASNGYISDFENCINFKIDESCFDDSGDAIVLNLGVFANDTTKTVIKFIDHETGVGLYGFEAEISEAETGEVVFVTNKGSIENIVEKLKVGVAYIIKEKITSPKYVRNENVEFVVSNTNEPLIVKISAKRIYSSIRLIQKGDVLRNAAQNKKGEYNCLSFGWSTKRLPKIEYELRAAEDIIHADVLSGVIYKTGQVISKKETSIDGTICFDRLPLGKYELFMTSTLCGCVKHNKPVLFTLDSDVAAKYILYATRQNLFITVTNIGFDNNLINGAVYGLFSDDVICNIDNRVIASKDTLIDIFSIRNSGKLTYTAKVPLGKYYIKQLSPADGYMNSDETFPIDFTATNDLVKSNSKNVEFNFNHKSDPICLTVSVPDAEDDGCEVQDVCMQILQNKTLLYEWTSTEIPCVIKAIPIGKYTLRAKSAPKGYRVPGSIEFGVEKTKEQVVDYTVPRVKLNLILNTVVQENALSGVSVELQNDILEQNKKSSSKRSLFSCFKK